MAGCSPSRRTTSLSWSRPHRISGHGSWRSIAARRPPLERWETGDRRSAVRRRSEHRLDLERRGARVLGADQRGEPGDVRCRETVAGSHDPPAIAPGDVDVDAVRPEFDQWARVVVPDPLIGDIVGSYRDDR